MPGALSPVGETARVTGGGLGCRLGSLELLEGGARVTRTAAAGLPRCAVPVLGKRAMPYICVSDYLLYLYSIA